ncbi:hypothetical protein, partial [Aeromonas veronii]|uniref:hypothetical protein n=1 Tax=Aeromonas veronii TaxID=654 RepID=UPI0039F5B12C
TDLKWMMVIRSPSFQLVPFKLHQFGQQRRDRPDVNGNSTIKSHPVLSTIEGLGTRPAAAHQVVKADSPINPKSLIITSS